MAIEDKLTVEEFATKIRNKYNAYQDIEDSVLVEKYLEKYPVYEKRIKFDEVETTVPTQRLEPGQGVLRPDTLLEPGQGVLTPEVFEQGKQIPVAETTAPAMGLTEQAAESMLREDLEITDLVSEDGSLESPTEEWEPKYASEYYLSKPLMDKERALFEEWKKKKTRKALPEEIELAKDKEYVLKPLKLPCGVVASVLLV